MTSKYTNSSPYFNTPINNRFLGYYVHRPIPQSENETTLTLSEKYQYAPDLLARDVYGKGYEDYWWVIPLRNGLEDLVFDMVTGIELVIPPKNVLDEL